MRISTFVAILSLIACSKLLASDIDYEAGYHIDLTGTNGYSYCAAADLDGDNANDLVSYDQDSILLLINDDKGKSFFRYFIQAQDEIKNMVVADFDSDDDFDFVVSYGGLNLDFYENDGNAVFTVSPALSINQSIKEIAYADLQNDNVLDLVIRTDDGFGYAFGIGDGTFDSLHIATVTDYGTNMVIADMDGDGIPDIVSNNAAGNIRIYANLLNGEINSPIVVPPTANQVGNTYAIADIDNDNYPDILFISHDYPRSVRIFKNNGSLQFIEDPLNKITIGTTAPSNIEMIDIDDDNDLDLLCTIDIGYAQVLQYSNDGTGSFTLTDNFFYSKEAFAISSVGVSDLNADGFDDLVVHYKWDMTIFFHNQENGYYHPKRLIVPGEIRETCEEDYNQDSYRDIAVSGDNGLYLFLGDGDRAFSTPLLTPTPYKLNGLENIDYNNDGFVDVMATVMGSTFIYLFQNSGSGEFILSDSLWIGYAGADIETADLDNDTYDDIIVAKDGLNEGDNSVLSVFLNDGAGNFTTSSVHMGIYNDLNPGLNVLAIGDVNGDSFLDIAATSKDYAFRLYMNNQDGVFTFVGKSILFYSSLCLTAANLNGDMGTDYIALTSSNIILCENTGTGAFLTADSIYFPNGEYLICTIDVDKDGFDGFAAAHSGFVDVWRNNHTSIEGLCSIGATESDIISIKTVYLDGDDFCDFVISDGNAIYIIYGHENIITSVDDDIVNNPLPRTYHLSQNYPNPFNPQTTIEYTIPRTSNVQLTVYNILGQHVTTLVDSKLPAGSYTVTWGGTDSYGNTVASGMYFYKIRTDDFTESKRMILLK